MELPVPRPVKVAIPADATDCHMHVFGPADRYPPSPQRTYTPVPATLDDYRKVATALHLERTVVVQPSAYGTDNSCTLDALAAIGPAARAVVGMDVRTPDEDLDRMNALGARGVRVNAASRGLRNADVIADEVAAIAGRISRLGWHLQIFTDLGVIERLATCLRSLPVPFVVDHMGHAKAAQGPAQRGLTILCDLLASGRCWVKLSGAYRVSAQEDGFTDAEAIIRTLIAANSDHVIWGTDWPHTGGHGHAQTAAAPPIIYRALDTTALLEQVVACAGNETVVQKILVENPARLYGY